MKNRMSVVGVLSAIVVLAAGSTRAEWDDVINFDPGQGELPESVATDVYGNLYASLSLRQSVLRISPDGSRQEFFVSAEELPQGALGALGITVDRRQDVYLAVQACGATGCSSSNGVWKIRKNGRASKLPGTEFIPFPNDVTLDRRGNVYVSDTISGAVWIVRAKRNGWANNHGNSNRNFWRAEVWIQDPLLLGTGILGQPTPLGANGIVYSPGSSRRGEILVANTEQASILAIAILHKGRPGDIQVIAGGACPAQPPVGLCDPRLLSVDGIAVDRYGDVFAVTPVQLGPAGPEPVSSLYSILRRTGEVRLVHSGTPMNLATDVAVGKSYDDAKNVWIANPGFLAPAFMLPIEPGIVRLRLDNTWQAAMSAD